MTHTHKKLSKQRRANPTPAQSALWQEIKGLNTGARFTRCKYRYGVMADFYCEHLKLCIRISTPKNRLDTVPILQLWSAQGLNVFALTDNEIMDHAGASKVLVMRRVFEILYEITQDMIRCVDGVQTYRLEQGVQLHVDLAPGVENTTERYSEIMHVVHRFAPGVLSVTVHEIPATVSTAASATAPVIAEESFELLTSI